MAQRITVLLLAAGLSRRMGRCKQLLPLEGTPLIAWVLERIFAAETGEITVVIGPNSQEVADAISKFPVTVARNSGLGDMAFSVRTGMTRVRGDTTGVIVTLVDHPLVTSATYRTLAGEHRLHPDAILIPTWEGKRGHPSLFPKQLLETMPSQSNLRELIRANPHRVRQVAVDDPGILDDMDLPEDYLRITSRLASV